MNLAPPNWLPFCRTSPDPKVAFGKVTQQECKDKRILRGDLQDAELGTGMDNLSCRKIAPVETLSVLKVPDRLSGSASQNAYRAIRYCSSVPPPNRGGSANSSLFAPRRAA